MGQSGFQDFWIAGSRVYFKRDDVDGNDQPLLDLGVVQSATPNFEITEVELKDADCGIRKTVARQVTDFTETYAVELSNFNPQNLSLLFLAEPPEDYTQSATQQVDVAQWEGHKGYLLGIIDGNGDRVHALTSVDTVKDSTGTTTYVEDTDYEIVDLDRGLIRIIEAGSMVEGDEPLITFTPTAISGLRLIRPQTEQRIEGWLELYYSREGCDQQTVRRARASIAPSGSTISSEDFSTINFNITILSDPTDSDEPAGELIYFKGTVPDKS